MNQMNTAQIRIAVTANFTAEPLAEVLQFWAEILGLEPMKVELAGYNQVFQSLLNQESLFRSREPGVNYVLIRLEDWGRNQDASRWLDAIRESAREFLTGIRAFAQRAARPTIVVLCPSTQQAVLREGAAAAFELLEVELRRVLAECRVTLLDHAEINRQYPVTAIEDLKSDHQGHIPFTQGYWTAIGTMLARKARALLQPPRKVIAVDADHTLWGGVAAEAGAAGVDLSESWREVQAFLARMKDRGMLLALVSKNRAEDVEEVFRRPEMVLHREDFAAWKVNWRPKSENLRELASELELGLDSFIFLDDNPMECAEVQAHHPAVTVLQLDQPGRALEFLEHAWIFDLPATTSVDSGRTAQYREEAHRKELLAAAGSYADFFKKLELKIDLFPPAPEQVERAAQLTQRTNQFNATGLRRTPSELAVVLSSGERRALMAHVSDRFGDYGDVGLCIYSNAGGDLEVDTFLLSCRVLGKGVEHHLLAALGRAAAETGGVRVVVPFRRAERNEPVFRFLESVGNAFRSGDAYFFPATAAAGVSFNPAASVGLARTEAAEASAAAPAASCDLGAIARDFATVPEIQLAIRRRYRRIRPELPNGCLRPRNATEEKLVEIWTDVLGLDQVGVLDNFYDLGGDSIKTIQVFAQTPSLTGKTINFLAAGRCADDHLSVPVHGRHGQVGPVPVAPWPPMPWRALRRSRR